MPLHSVTQTELCSRYLTQLLRHGPMPRKYIFEMAKLSGFSAQSVKSAASTLNVISTRKGFPCTATWELPNVQ